VLTGASIFSLASAAGTIQFGITGKREAKPEALRKRASGIVAAPLSENQYFVQYYANVTIGTPPQPLQLMVDTGSSDIWAVSSTAPICQSQGACALGTFDQTQSSTFIDYGVGEFQDNYADGSSTTGDFFLDTFGIGGMKVTEMRMGVALNTSIDKGIMGIGFDTEEAGGTLQYPNLVDTMVNESIINSQAYSLWLDDRNARSGSLLFGGIDTGKYSGELYNVAMYASQDTGIIDRFTVALTSVSVTSPSGSETVTAPGTAEPVVLDSGTTMTILPDDMAQAVYNVVGAVYQADAQAAVVPCPIGDVAGTIDFQFGGADGPTIKVPMSEMVYALFNNDGSQATFQNGQPACQFGIEPASSLGQNAALLVGDTVLRSAYVVYDLANFRIGLAQTDFNSTTSNVVAFDSLGAQIPSATTVANENAVTQTAGTGNIGPTQTAVGTAAAITSAQFTGSAGAAFSSAYTKTAATAGATGTGSGKKGAGVAGPRPFAWEAVSVLGLSLGFMLVGGGVMML